MANFSSKKIDFSTINGGNRYENGNIVDADAINAPIEASAYAQQVAEQALNYVGGQSGTYSPLLAYPVGSIYISVSATDPASLFGGTWVRIQGKFLLAAGGEYEVGSEGGVKENILEQSQLPSGIKGQFRTYSAGNNFGLFNDTDMSGVFKKPTTASAKNAAYADTVYSTDASVPYNGVDFDLGGKSSPIENMPPYMAVYMWQRTA
jgi:hypothetical protein